MVHIQDAGVVADLLGPLEGQEVRVHRPQAHHGIQHGTRVQQLHEEVVLAAARGIAREEVLEVALQPAQVPPGRQGQRLGDRGAGPGELHQGQALHVAGFGGRVFQQAARIADVGHAADILGPVQVAQGRVVEPGEETAVHLAGAPHGQRQFRFAHLASGDEGVGHDHGAAALRVVGAHLDQLRRQGVLVGADSVIRQREAEGGGVGVGQQVEGHPVDHHRRRGPGAGHEEPLVAQEPGAEAEAFRTVVVARDEQHGHAFARGSPGPGRHPAG